MRVRSRKRYLSLLAVHEPLTADRCRPSSGRRLLPASERGAAAGHLSVFALAKGKPKDSLSSFPMDVSALASCPCRYCPWSRCFGLYFSIHVWDFRKVCPAL